MGKVFDGIHSVQNAKIRFCIFYLFFFFFSFFNIVNIVQVNHIKFSLYHIFVEYLILIG